MRPKFSIVATFLALTMGSSSMADVLQVDIQAGRRWYSAKTDGDYWGAAGDEYKVTALMSPFPLIPIAAGLSLSQDKIHGADLAGGSGDTQRLGLLVQSSFPMRAFRPFVRGSYNLWSSLNLTSKVPDTDSNGNPTGTKTTITDKGSLPGGQLAIGCLWEILPHSSLVVEGDLGIEMTHISSVRGTVDPIAPPSDSAFNSKALLVGLSASL